jgi:hypothetical protein
MEIYSLFSNQKKLISFAEQKAQQVEAKAQQAEVNYNLSLKNIDEIYKSNSWRITALFRFLSLKTKYFIKYFLNLIFYKKK